MGRLIDTSFIASVLGGLSNQRQCLGLVDGWSTSPFERGEHDGAL